MIKPCSVTAVVLETVRLKQFRQKLHYRPKVAANRQLLQCDHHVPSHTGILAMIIQVEAADIKCTFQPFCMKADTLLYSRRESQQHF